MKRRKNTTEGKVDKRKHQRQKRRKIMERNTKGKRKIEKVIIKETSKTKSKKKSRKNAKMKKKEQMKRRKWEKSRKNKKQEKKKN